jgi:hypothetical protein
MCPRPFIYAKGATKRLNKKGNRRHKGVRRGGEGSQDKADFAIARFESMPVLCAF